MVKRVQIGPNVVAVHFPGQHRLAGDHPLRRDSSAVQPHGDPRLSNLRAGMSRQHLSELGLPTGADDHHLHSVTEDRFESSMGIVGHMRPPFNTGSVIGVNTRSVIGLIHNRKMARSADICEFWVRLTRARRAKNPSASMRQKDIGHDYDVSQALVTKWKTGKMKPGADLMRQIAMRENVTLEWLDLGRGDMIPPKATDAITLQVIEAMANLQPEGKVEVLKAALTQQMLQMPALAAQLEQAHKAAERLKPASKRSA